MAFVYVSVEISFHQVGKIGTGRHSPAVIDPLVGSDGYGEISVFNLGIYRSGPKAFQKSTRAVEYLHTVVFGCGFCCHALGFEPQTYSQSPLFGCIQPFGGGSLDGDGYVGVVLLKTSDFCRKRDGRGASNVEPCFDGIFPSVQIGFPQGLVVFFALCMQAGCCQKQTCTT